MFNVSIRPFVVCTLSACIVWQPVYAHRVQPAGQTTITRRAPDPDAQPKTEQREAKASYLVVDATEPTTGTTVSLDADFDVSKTLPKLEGDATFSGTLQTRNGYTFPLRVDIARNYVNVLSLRQVPGRQSEYEILAGDVAQPKGRPYRIYLQERAVEGTSVKRLTGEIFDPQSGINVNFTITHDPAPIVVIGIVAGIAALLCGAIVLTEVIINNCVKQAKAQCGERKVLKITVNPQYGFSWGKDGPEIGCGQKCIIDCAK